MQKTLFAMLVAVVSIVGWQVIQKYKVDGLDLASLKQRIGWNTSTTTYPPANPQQHPGLNPYAYGPQQYPQQQQYPAQQQFPTQQPYPAQQPGYPYAQQQPVQPIPYPTGYAPPHAQQYPQQGYGQQPAAQSASYPPLAPLPTSTQYSQPGYPAQQPGLAPLPGYGNTPQQPYAQQQPYGQQPHAQDPLAAYGAQQPVAAAHGGTIKIASFNIQVFGESKLRKPEAMRTLVDLVRRFDVVAIQEVRAVSDEILPRFIAEINATGRRYDFVVGPRLGRTNSKEQYAFVFDTATVECDRSATYTVQDPDDRLHREPLVGCFRTRNVPPQQAFTFTLVNIHTDPDEVSQELLALADVLRAVRNDGRGEDDVLLLGDLNADERMLAGLAQATGSSLVVSGIPTNTKGTKTYDNLLYARNATTEFTKQWGVVDFGREYSLAPHQAEEVSDHRPIWAEFSVYEGGQQQQMVRSPVGMLDR